MRKSLFVMVLLIFFLSCTPHVSAIENPLDTPNNKFGIHIIDENDLEAAAKLVNSNGGEWGYVTLVIREDERDINRWQQTFDKMRELKLIPIVRLATQIQDGAWAAPSAEDATDWADFLGSLDWVVKNRYVILFNEPNHSKEWANNISAQDYARVARSFWEQLKRQSEDFFVLPAGFDAAAVDGTKTANEVGYWKQMYDADPLIFTIFDGWTSHSYPNPGFSGSPFDTGKMSIRGFEWEINFLKEYGLSEDIPVFITETGWTHSGKPNELDKLSEKYKIAYETAWDNSRIVAITPFVLNYLAPPFDAFTWTEPTTGKELPHFDMVKGIQKTRGEPADTNKPTSVPTPFASPNSVNSPEDQKAKTLLKQVIDLLSKVTERFVLL